ncbi:c-type cytochrome [Psychroserpens sp.]
MKTIYIIAATMLVLASCNKTKQDTVSKTESVAVNATKVEQSEGYTLFKNNCYACHSVISASHDEIIAPPMVAVKRRYQKSYTSKETFVEAFVNWSKDPKEENALMRGAVQQFKVMPKQVFNEADLKKIASYIYDNEIEQPDWFEAHFKEEHGGKGNGMGKGKGMKMQGGQNKWIEQMKLDGDNKWDANIETTQGIEKLQDILKNDKSQSIADFQNLEKKLAGVMTTIFDECTMKGASHDNLHTFLVPLIKKVDMLKEVSSVKQGKIISMRISSHLTEYRTFFK